MDKMHEAKTHPSRLGDRTAGGQPLAIATANTPMVEVVPLDTQTHDQTSRLGFMRGQFEVPDDFDHMGEAEVALLFAADGVHGSK